MRTSASKYPASSWLTSRLNPPVDFTRTYWGFMISKTWGAVSQRMAPQDLPNDAAMKPIILRMQLILVAAGYVAVLAMVFMRYMQYVHHPEDTAAAGGMWAGGDLALEIILGFLFFPRQLRWC